MRPLEKAAELGRRLLYWLQRERRERELLEEMEEHRARMGDPRRFGSTLRLGDQAREVWGWVWLDQLVQDLRIAARSLTRDRLFFASATAVLALAIGANAAIFSVVEAVLVERLPFREPDRLVALAETMRVGRQEPVAPATLREWRARSRSFESLEALAWRGFELTGHGEPLRIQAQAVTAGLFETLGARPALGRAFLSGEDRPGAGRVAVVSHALWQSALGGDPGVVGRAIQLDQESYTVVGVMGPSFQLYESYTGIWVPMALTPEQWADTERSLRVVARLRPDVRSGEARAELAAVAAGLAGERSDVSGVRLQPLQRELLSDSRRPLLLLLAAVGVVLLAACADLAGLFLTRGLTRRHELAVRAALGAGRGRIVRQLCAESAVVALPAAALGVGLAHLALPLLAQLVPPGRQLSAPLVIDGAVLAFAAGVASLAALGFGLLPALRVSRPELGELSLVRGGRRGSGRAQALLVVGQVAVALLLVAEAGLLIQSLRHLRGQYAGLRPGRLLTLRTALSVDRYWNAARRRAFYDEVLARVEALPGVRRAGYTTSLPLEWAGGGHELALEGRAPAPGEAFQANHRQVSPHYLETLGAAAVAGRLLEDGDAADAPRVVVVNETLAKRFWPGLDPIGRRLALAPGAAWRRVVGVVRDVRQMGVDEPVHPELYLPYSQVASHPFLRPRDLVIRVDVDPASLAGTVRDAIHSVDPLQPVSLLRTFDEILEEQTAARRLQGSVLACFASLALLLAALGIHGVLAHGVAQQTREIGVRLALGASPARVLGAVLGRAARLGGLGIVAGLLLCAAVTPVTRHLLFQVAPADPGVHLAVVGLLAAVALVGGLGPAWSAARVDPVHALRRD